MVLSQNGEMVNTGVGAAALGNPATCVAWLANRLADYDISLKAGEVILSGALSGMVVANPGDKDRKSTRLNSSHVSISYAVFCLKKKKKNKIINEKHIKDVIMCVIVVCIG